VKDSNGNSSPSGQSSSSLAQSSSSSVPSSSSLAQSSSSSVPSSSSLVQSSSSSVAVRIGKGNDINNYRTVEIGTQTWMAENLDYNASGSKCYNNLDSNCDLYGRLYEWSTAMYLPGCNTISCLDQIQSPHRGICPEGWHIPSKAEWEELMSAVGGRNSAGAKLKAKTGWSDCGPNGSGSSYLCEDTYDFSALPGGNVSDGTFSGVGYSYWWSADEGSNYNADCLYMYSGGVGASWGTRNKYYSCSVRCIKDN